MSASQTASGRSAANFRSSRFGATGRSWRLSGVRGTRRRRRATVRPPPRTSTAPPLPPAPAPSHHPRPPLAADPDALRPQLGVDPRAAVGPPARGEDGPDPFAHPPVALAAATRPAVQPSVEAADRHADDPAQRPHRGGGALGGDEPVPHEATASRAKKAAAFLRISFSCSSRLFSRRSRASSAASAFCRARASAEPAASRSLRQPRSRLGWTPSSSATACKGLPLSSSRFTASALYSAVNRRRFLFSIVPSRCWWPPPYGGAHPAGAGSEEPLH